LTKKKPMREDCADFSRAEWLANCLRPAITWRGTGVRNCPILLLTSFIKGGDSQLFYHHHHTPSPGPASAIQKGGRLDKKAADLHPRLIHQILILTESDGWRGVPEAKKKPAGWLLSSVASVAPSVGLGWGALCSQGGKPLESMPTNTRHAGIVAGVRGHSWARSVCNPGESLRREMGPALKRDVTGDPGAGCL